MSTSPSVYRTTGFLLILEGILMFVPIIILGAAINWPASLGEPASIVLPLILKQLKSVAIGYFIYLIYSVMFFPVALLLVKIVKGDRNNTPSLHMAVGFAIASMVCRTLGIIRWLVAMPVLAQIYMQADIPETTRITIDVVYQALNSYGGSIGEELGVSLFATLWLVIVAIEILKTRTLTRWLGFFGLVSAALLATQLLELFGVDVKPLLPVSVTVLQIWFLAAGIVCLQYYAKFKRNMTLSKVY